MLVIPPHLPPLSLSLLQLNASLITQARELSQLFHHDSADLTIVLVSAHTEQPPYSLYLSLFT